MSSPILSAKPLDKDWPVEWEEQMPQTEWHGFLLGLILQSLRWFYRDAERVVATGDMFFYYDPADRRACVGPDVFVVRGAERRWRRRWLAWEDGVPEFVLELLSDGTAGSDLGDKLALYRDTLRVREYFVFDPEGGLMRPRLRGFRLVGGEYADIEPVDGRLPSEVTGLHLEQHGDALRFWDPATGAWLPTDAERADAAEERVRQLEAELARRGAS